MTAVPAIHREHAMTLKRDGHNVSAICAMLGVPADMVREWLRGSLRDRMAEGYAAAAAFALDAWADTSVMAERTQQPAQAELLLANANMWDAEHRRCQRLAYLIREMA